MITLKALQENLLLAHFEGHSTYEDVVRFLRSIESKMADNIPFGLILTQADAKEDEKAHALKAKWARDHKGRLQAVLMGVVSVIEDEHERKYLEPLAKPYMEKIYGCYGAIAKDLNEAIALLNKRLGGLL